MKNWRAGVGTALAVVLAGMLAFLFIKSEAIDFKKQSLVLSYLRELKDIDARWGSKHGKHYFGYKNHVKVDRHSKLIDNFVVSPANLHDSQALPDLAEDCDAGQQYLADSAYGTPDNHAAMGELQVSLQAIEQARRNKPLTERQRLWNQVRSRVRARVEHVFGHMAMCIKGLTIRCKGLDRAHAQIAMANLAYNFQRVLYLNRNAMGSV